MTTPTTGDETIRTGRHTDRRDGAPGTATAEELILARVFAEVGAERYARFFDDQARIRVAPGHLDVTVASGFAAQMLDRKFGDVLRRAASDSAACPERPGSPVEVRFRVDGGAFGRRDRSAAASPGAAPARNRPAPRPGRNPAHAAPRHRLEHFVVGECNRLAFSAAEEFCRAGTAQRHPPLFIHGPCGVGKTHLLHGIASRWLERGNGAVRCTTAEAFTNEFITAVRSNRIDAFRKSYRAVEVLCIDDVHFLSAKQGTQTELLHTFDALDMGGARVVLASDEHPRAIQKLSDSLASRFMAGMVVLVEEPEPALRERIIRALAAKRGLPIEDGAARLIASWQGGPSGGGSVRDLEGLVTRVEAVSRLLAPAGAPAAIDLQSVRRALGLGTTGQVRPRLGARRPIRVDAIAAEVCRTLGVEYSDMCGRGRHARVVVARALTVWLSRRLTTMSFPEIARAMGRPNHSSVITSYRRIEGQLAADGVPGPDLGGLSLRDLASQLESRLVRGATPA